MTKRLSPTPAPAPLEAYVQHFDPLFAKYNQRAAVRQYLAGLLLGAERNKTLTALANTEPIVGAQQPEAQRLQWFLSEATWDPHAINLQRLMLLRTDPTTAPTSSGALVIDESGDRKAGTKTAHVGRQYLANIGKIDNGVVSVSSLWADEQLYYPLEVEPYTPAHHFVKGKDDPQFRTKPQLALQLVQQAVAHKLPFRAVVADCFYGEHHAFKQGLHDLGVGYVVALQPSHAWWHPAGAPGALWEVAQAAEWAGPSAPGDWVKVVRTFRDGHTEDWWALEVVTGPYSPTKGKRAVVTTTDPAHLPPLATWYLETTLPTPDQPQSELAAQVGADLAEVVRLYGLRMWIEQSYKQIKHALGWAQYQVRSAIAIQRHWVLVYCAFSFCWWHQSVVTNAVERAPSATMASSGGVPDPDRDAERKKKQQCSGAAATTDNMAASVTASTGVARAVDVVMAVLAWMDHNAPTKRVAAVV